MADRSAVEDFSWAALYADGDGLAEVTPNGVDHGFAEVDQSRLSAFCLVPSRMGLPNGVLKLHEAGSRPIYFRRRTIANVLNGGSEVTATVTVLGFQQEHRLGKNQTVTVKAFVAFYSDGSVLVSDRDDF